ncbi:hypothetical protein EDC04DRAFT_2556550 [Pisolithus marmoratus]|nr:hypothetical protein EDC04DRAFT_2556550 [Pisolithus marmoratus]
MRWQHSSQKNQEDLSLELTEDHTIAHPTISLTLPDPHNSNAAGDMWTYHFRPKRAEEVLGNEKRALYLRNWLRALELQSQTQLTANPGTTDAIKKQNGKCEPRGSQPRGEKRPRVVRAVTKLRGRKKQRFSSEDELNDFIACSDGDDVPDVSTCEESEDEFAFCQRTLSRLHRKDVSQSQPSSTPPLDTAQLPGSSNCSLSDATEALADPTFSDTLTNTLLMAGPPGCGKTAAVYACAEELGWDVFEVYPGIGRRTAASLDYLVGNVGRNHTIQVSQSRSSTRQGEQGSSATRPALFGKGWQEPVAHRAEEGSESSIKILGSRSPKPTVVEAESTVRQSLVLLEEVDILFKEDAGFWPAVVDLIRDCKRPVVMTCNDLRLIPIESLPLQTILVFESCPSPVAVSYLQSVMVAQGCPVPRERLMALYETTATIDGIEPPLYSRTEPLPSPDLRRTITQLQMLCLSAARGSTSDMLQGTREAAGHVRRSGRPISVESIATRLPSTECKRWRRMSKHADLLSFVDSNLCRAPLHTPEALSFSVTEPTRDDELGHSMLFMDGCVLNGREGLAFYHWDELIALDAIQLSRGIHEELDTDPTAASINPAASLTTEEAEIFRSRVAYQSQIAGALQHIIQPPAPLMPQSSVFLDYIPWVRYMAVVDDNLEQMAQDEAARVKSARLTRNSMKTRHVRNIDLDERQREVLSRTQLDEWTSTGGNARSLQSPASDHIPASFSLHQKDSSRHSPGISLPPLDYLQQQRRGSVTDPSLHAASTGPSALRHLDGINILQPYHLVVPRHSPNHSTGPRPAANYVFGDGSLSNSSSEPSNKQMRKILRSPSPDRDRGHPANGKGVASPHASSYANGNSSMSLHVLPNNSGSPGMSNRHQDDSDYNSSRRQSIATSSDSQHPHGTKRKMSIDREAAATDDVDSHLVGPGIPSSSNVDLEGRAPKRRGSAVETHRVAQLSIYDHRRHSIHAGAMVSGPGVTGGPAGNGTQWWHDRRDSLPAILPNGSSGCSAFSADQPHGRPSAPTTSGSMATFVWPATQHPGGQPDPNIQSQTRPFEPQTLSMPIMPSMTFPPDRRMSVPENATSAVGPTRHVRSRSRPPSRQLREAVQPTATQAGTAASTEEPSTAPPSSTTTLKPTKEPGSTPYSRSPELRVSHKLAERKRRKEMKELFDELRDQLPADRGMKASKWEILSKAIDFVNNLKQSHQDMAREIDMLRHELDNLRQGMPFGPGGTPHSIVYGQGPVPGPYPPGSMPHPPPPHAHPPPHQQPQVRPSSSENAYQPGGGPPPHQQSAAGVSVTNGTASISTGRVEGPPT